MKRYIQIYKQLWRMNFSIVISRRFDALNSIVSSLMWAVFLLISVQLLMARTASVRGWTVYDMMILAITYSVVIGFHRVLFSRGFDQMVRVIHKGELDMFLLKPLDPQFLLTASNIAITSIVRAVCAIGFLIGYIIHLHLAVGFIEVIEFILFTACSLTLIYSFGMIFSTLLFWMQQNEALIELLNFLVGSSHYPREIVLQTPLVVSVLFVPFLLLVNVPTKVLIHGLAFSDGLLLVSIAGILFCCSRVFWKFALRFYTGASG